MALTIEVLAQPRATPGEPGDGRDVGAAPPGALTLTFDTPRLVIGRGDGCDLRLPDPSVSARHASIRQRGTEYVVLDEGSTNGTFLDRVKLPPQSPRVIRTGQRVRVGRVWLEVRVEPAAAPSPPAAAKALALELVARALAAQGEDGRPLVRVESGPNAGAELRLGEVDRPYVIGRSRDADLPLDDPDASRRHADVRRRGGRIVVHDLGSKAGCLLDGMPVPPSGVVWSPGQILAIGSTTLALEDAAAEALAELERSPDEPIRPGEVLRPPNASGEEEPATDETAEPAPADAAPPSETEVAAARLRRRAEPQPASPTWGFADAAVAVLAAFVLALSIAGLWWLFRR